MNDAYFLFLLYLKKQHLDNQGGWNAGASIPLYVSDKNNYALYFPISTQALCPPKPKELLRA